MVNVMGKKPEIIGDKLKKIIQLETSEHFLKQKNKKKIERKRSEMNK